MANVVLLNSGGLDTGMLAKWLQTQGHSVHSLFIDTNQVNRIPTMTAAQETATRYCTSHYIITVDFGNISNYWDGGDFTIPYDPENLPEENLFFGTIPNLGMVVMSLGVAYGKLKAIFDVYGGFRGEYRQMQANEFNGLASLNTPGLNRPQLHSPLWAAHTYQECMTTLGITNAQEFSYTYSCNYATPCGVCYKCTGRASVGLT